MVRSWIEPLYFIAVVCGVYVWDLCPPRSVENERRETESDIRDQEQQKEKCDMRGRQARRWEASQMAVLHDMLMKVIIGSTCRTQTTIAQNVRRKPSEDLAVSVSSASARRTATATMFWPLSFLLGCLLMCVDIGELHPQLSLSSRCPHYSITFHSPRANKARFSV